MVAIVAIVPDRDACLKNKQDHVFRPLLIRNISAGMAKTLNPQKMENGLSGPLETANVILSPREMGKGHARHEWRVQVVGGHKTNP